MSTPFDDAALAELFHAEALEIIEELERLLLRLEGEGSDSAAQAEAYRAFHTLKGMANMAGFDALASACHEAEAALAQGQSPDVDALLRKLDDISARLHEAEATHAPAIGTVASKTVNVDVGRLDNLLNLVGELSVAETRLGYEWRQSPTGVSEEAVSRLSHLARLLQEEVMRARLLPVRSLFAQLPRLARDTAKASGKRVRVETDAGNLELDRTIVDRMTGALAHLVQNAVAHGIETPAARERAGKPPEGRVVVRARREHETTLIEVEDDGRGIDLEAVKRHALEQELLTPEEAEALDVEKAIDLLMLPGFTTSANAGRHAGRGVGLTAARDVARALGGDVSFQTRHGQGLRVVVRLPPSVAVVDTLIVASGRSTLALPLRNVHRISLAQSIQSIAGATSLLHDGAPLPVFEASGSRTKSSNTSGFVVIARGARGPFGIHVDRVLGTHSSILKPLDVSIPGAGVALGATILGSGRLAIVLNPDAFLGVATA